MHDAARAASSPSMVHSRASKASSRRRTRRPTDRHRLPLALTAPSAPALAAAATVSASRHPRGRRPTALLDVAPNSPPRRVPSGRVGTFTITIRNTRQRPRRPARRRRCRCRSASRRCCRCRRVASQVPKTCSASMWHARPGARSRRAPRPRRSSINVRAAIGGRHEPVGGHGVRGALQPADHARHHNAQPPGPAGPVGAGEPRHRRRSRTCPPTSRNPWSCSTAPPARRPTPRPTWSQVPQSGEPTVVFAAGGDGRTASFAAPVVTDGDDACTSSSP